MGQVDSKGASKIVRCQAGAWQQLGKNNFNFQDNNKATTAL